MLKRRVRTSSTIPRRGYERGGCREDGLEKIVKRKSAVGFGKGDANEDEAVCTTCHFITSCDKEGGEGWAYSTDSDIG